MTTISYKGISQLEALDDIRYFLDKYEKNYNFKDLYKAKLMIKSMIIYRKIRNKEEI